MFDSEAANRGSIRGRFSPTVSSPNHPSMDIEKLKAEDLSRW